MAHGISRIRIKNFCSCKEVSMVTGVFTPLVGYNNAGKSNILEAVIWLLKKSTLDASKFYEDNNEVIVEADITGITDNLLQLLAPNHRSALETYLVDEAITIRRKQPTPGCTAAQVVLEVRNNAVGEGEDNAWGRPGGIENAIKEIFPDPIVIEAMDDATGDISKVAKNNTIGRIIAEIIEPIEAAHGQQLRGILDEVGAKLSFDGNDRAEELNEFDANASSKLQELFPGLTVKLHIPTPQVDALFKGGTVKIFEQGYGEHAKDINSLGHGAQRSIQMALIRYLAEVKRGANIAGKTTLLLIDEPELYLHPQAIEYVRTSLKRLSNEGYQVIFTTHSAQMIEANDVGTALLVRKTQENGTRIRERIEEAVKQVINDAPAQLDILFSLTNSSQILFSEIVLLAEGKTERKLLPKVFEKLTGSTLAEKKIALVDQQGVGNTVKSLTVLNVLDIPAKALVDLDFAFNGAIQSGVLNENDEDILVCKTCLRKIAGGEGIELSENGLPKKGGRLTPSKSFSKLAEQAEIQKNLRNLHIKLLQHNIWIWTKGAIEDHFGNGSKKEPHLAQFSKQIESERLQDVLADFDEVKAFCEWASAEV